MKRRSLLKYSLIAGGAAASGALVYSQIPYDEIDQEITQLDFEFFDQQDQIVLTAIIPIMLVGTNQSPKQIAQVIVNMDQAILFLSKQTQKELRELFDLLANKLGRVVLVGIWSSWRTANAEQLIEFLNDWRDSYIDLIQIGYQGLKQLVVGNYYADAESWSQIGYPGPPKLI